MPALPLSQAQSAFVQLEPGSGGPYHIVAAGRFRIDGSPAGATYNGLQVRSLGTFGDMFLYEGRYDTYHNPDASTASDALIVKGTTDGGLGQSFLSVVRFEDASFVFTVGPRDGDPESFMLEISRIPGQ